MKSPAIISENSFLGSITSSSIRNLLPRSISAKQKLIRYQETKSSRSNDENAVPADPNIQNHQQSPQKLFQSANQIPPSDTKDRETLGKVEARRTNSVLSEITEEDDPLGDQIRELKDELIRTKSDGYKAHGSKSGHFARDSLTQLRVSINKSLLTLPATEGIEMSVDRDDDDVMELNKHIDKLHASFDSLHSSFASASCCEADSMSEDDDDDGPNKLLDTAASGISIRPQLPPTCILEEPIFSESPKIRNFHKSLAASTKFLASPKNASESSSLKADQVSPSVSRKLSGPTDSLAASLQRGLQIIDSHQQSSLSKSSSVSFSFGHMALKPDNLNASVQSFRKDGLLCLSCRKKVDQQEDAGSDGKQLQSICMEQATKIEELTRLRRKSGDGVEVIKEVSGASDASEKEALLKEIAELKSKLQPTKSADNVRSSLLLRSIQMRKSIDVTKNAENYNSDALEKEREMWTEMESEWISLTDDLRMDIDKHRIRAENLEIELKQEKLATQELNDALTRAMLGHSRFIEQYTELQENYNELVEKHGVMVAGITDVKKAASKAAMNGRHGKRFAKAFSAELSAIRAEKEKEREALKKENKSLRSQLRDTAEAVQAAGELLVRLRESEQALQVSEERFSVVEDEKERLKEQMEKLKSKHKTEMGTMKQYLAESRLPGSALLQPWYKEEEEEQVSEHPAGAVSFDDYEDDQAWRAEFGAIYQDHHY